MRHKASSPHLLGATLLACAAACGGGAPAGRPNVVLIVVDTLRAEVLDDPENLYDTPNLDALAREGIRFPRAFSHAPMTLPSHTALFSSRLPLESGVVNNGQLVPADLPLLAEWMHQYGYRTQGVISLGTLQRNANAGGLERGFDVYEQEIRMLEKAEGVQPRMLRTLEALDTRPAEGEASPFFFFAHYCDPHEPYRSHGTAERWATMTLDGVELDRLRIDDGPQWVGNVQLDEGDHELKLTSDVKFRGRAVRAVGPRGGARVEFPGVDLREPTNEFTATIHAGAASGAPGMYELFVWANDQVEPDEIRQRYALEVEHVDHYVGELIQDLKRRGLYDDALLVFTSDHGESLGKLGERGHIGHVRYLYDPLIHVPLVVKPPKGSSIEKRLRRWRDEPVSLIDITPTILAACGLPALPGQRGFSLLEAERPTPYEHVAETHKPEAPNDRIAIRDDRYKMVYVLDDDSFAMYDLESDPLEAVDRFDELAGERPDWPRRLKVLAAQAALRTRGDASSEDQARMLEALGYGGGQ